jgi:hypothetical protein
MEGLCNHLKPSDFSRLIEERGLERCTWGPMKQHLTECPECLQMLGQFLRTGAPSISDVEPLSEKTSRAVSHRAAFIRHNRYFVP